MKKILQKIMPGLVPALITFGPLFMVIYSDRTTSSSGWRMFSQYGTTLVGAVALGAGLAWMFKILMRQEQEILRLGQLLASGSSVHE